MASTLADRLHSARKTAKLSQATLAEKSGVARAAISQLEDGSSASMKADTLLRAARALGVDPYWLAFGESTAGVRDEAHTYAPRENARAVLERKVRQLDDTATLVVLNLVEYLLALRKMPFDPKKKRPTAGATAKA